MGAGDPVALAVLGQDLLACLDVPHSDADDDGDTVDHHADVARIDERRLQAVVDEGGLVSPPHGIDVQL